MMGGGGEARVEVRMKKVTSLTCGLPGNGEEKKGAKEGL